LNFRQNKKSFKSKEEEIHAKLVKCKNVICPAPGLNFNAVCKEESKKVCQKILLKKINIMKRKIQTTQETL